MFMDNLVRRGLLDGGLLGGTDTSVSPSSTSTGGGLIGQLGTDLGNVGSAVNSLVSSVLPVPSSTPISLSSSLSSTVSTPSSSSIASSSTPSSSLSSSQPLPSSTSSLPVSSPPVSSPPVSTPEPSSVGPVYVTSVITSSSSSASEAAATAPAPKSFLENKPLSGTIFGLVGLVLLIIVVIIITTYVRKRSRNRLHDDAANISWNPTDVEGMAAAPSEKISYSASRSGHGHNGYVASDQGSVTGPMTQVPDSTYGRQDYGAVNPTAYMSNPYTAYGNPGYQQPRSTSPMYGNGAPAGNPGYKPPRSTSPMYGGGAPAGNAYAAYPVNDSRGHVYADTPALPPKDRTPPPRELPDHFGADVYGGVTSVDNYRGPPQAARNLHVANE